MNRPRLAFVVTEDWYFWSHRAALARAAVDAGYDVSVVTRVTDHGDRIEALGLRLVPWEVERGAVGLSGELGAFRSLVRALRDIKPDLVHNVALKPVVFGSLAARLAGCRRVVNALAGLGFVFSSQSARARRLRLPLRVALRLALAGRASRVIVQNPEDGGWLRGIGVPAERLHLIRGAGVDIERFSPAPEPSQPPFVVTMVSRMLKNKGVDTMVACGRLLRQKGEPVEIRLVGPPDPGNLGSLTEDELQALNDEGVVRWEGPREDIPAVWQEAHVAALPSTYGEGLPKSLLEAAAAGRPIIATDLPGCREIAREDETALVVPPDDPPAVADAILRLAADGELRRRLGARARAMAENEFADAIIIGAVLALYEDLLNA